MITGFLISVFLTVVQFMIGWLPIGWALPTSLFTAAIDLATPLSDVSWFLPVQQLINVILWTIPIMGAVLVFRIILFLLGVIRKVDYARHHGYM